MRAVYTPENLGTVIQFDSTLGWRLKPNASMRSVDWGSGVEHRISVNASGLREREIEPRKRPGRKRILIMGDSVAYGTGIDVGDRFSDLLNEALVDAEVINAGVPGWGNDQELLYFEASGLALDPEVVILCLTMANDIVNNMLPHLFLGTTPKPRFVVAGDSLRLVTHSPPEPVPPIPLWRRLARRSRLAVFVKRRIDRIVYASLEPEATKRIPPGFHKGQFERNRSHWSAYRAVYDRELENAWQVTEHLIDRFHRLCKAKDIEFIVFGFPARIEVDTVWRAELERRTGVSDELLDFKRPYARLADFCHQKGIDLFYPVDQFVTGQQRHQLYFRDGHPNQNGHALAALVLIDKLHGRYHTRADSAGLRSDAMQSIH